MKDASRPYFSIGISALFCALLALAALHAHAPVLVAVFTLFFLLSLAEGDELSPRELFRRCARVPPDQHAWHIFFERYRDFIDHGILKIIGYSGPQRERLYKEAWANFHLRLLVNDRRALTAFRGETEYEARAYLRKIGITVALTTIERDDKYRGDPLPDDDDPNFKKRADGPDNMTHTDLENWLQRTLRGRNKARNILMFKLFALQDLKPAEIAQIKGLQMTQRAIEIQISRIREKVRKNFECK